MNDGAIVFSTELDNKTLEKQLNSLTRKIDSVQDKINQKQAERAPLANQSNQLAAQLDAAKAQLEYMRSGEKFYSSFAIDQQTASVQAVQREWDGVQARVDKYDDAISRATIELELNKEKAGAISKQLASVSKLPDAMSGAINKAGKSLNQFQLRMREVIRSALLFTLVSKALGAFRDWMGKVITTNAEASAAIARLRGALLTLAQPLVNVIIPAFTMLVNILAGVVDMVSRVISVLFGTTIDQSRESASALYEQTDAIKGTGAAAKKASKQLAAFDEINQLGSDSSSGGGGTSGSGAPDFSGASNADWLKERLGEAAGLVTAALLLGGIALVAIGAALGSLPLVLAGLLMLGVGIYVGEQTGVLQSWADALGLNDVAEFIIVAAVLGGIALIAIGAALKNISMVLAGFGLVGVAVAYSEKSGKMQSWTEALGINLAPTYVTAALLLGGIALVAIGAMMKNGIMVIAGLGLLGTGVRFGNDSGAFKSWWEVLNLPQVAQWVTVTLLLGGIALVAIGVATRNILMTVAGLGMLSAGVAFGLESGTLQKWWETLMLPEVAGWVTAALLLGGIGLLVIGIATGNLPMLLFGLGLLGTAIAFGITSGTFSRWIDDIKTGLANGWQDIKNWWNANVAPKLTLSFWESQFDNIKEGLISKIKDAVNGGITLFNKFIDWLNEKMKFSWDSFSIMGKEVITAGSIQLFTIPHIPKLAQGAVIPPNREFMAVLGDQKNGTNIETPLATMIQAFKIAQNESGGGNNTLILEIDGQQFGKLVYKANQKETKRIGLSLTEV